MRLPFVRAGAGLVVLALFGAGCASSSRGPGAAAVSDTSGGGPVAAQSACHHPYYPLSLGYAQTFKDSFRSLVNGEPQTTRYSWRVVELGAANAKLDIQFENNSLHTQQNVSCVGGALQAHSYVSLSGDQSLQAETLSSSGDYLPKDLHVGSVWDQTYQIVVHPGAMGGPVASDVQANVTIHHQAVREESVTVPAGTYTAMVVKSSAVMNLQGIGGSGAGAMPATEIQSTEWWVKNVGLVKAQTVLGGDYTATSEAETITLPSS